MPRALLSSKERRLLVLVGFFLGMTFTSFILIVFPWQGVAENAADAAAGFQERQGEKGGLERWRKRTARVGYDEAEPGDIVEWCVDNPSTGSSYNSGRPSQPLLWENPRAVPRTSATTGGRCAVVLARVVERRPQGLLLTFLGKP